MSEFTVPIVKIASVQKHPNADTLSITRVNGVNVIFKTDDFHEGQYAIYIPVDAVVPKNVPGTEFLGERRRIRAVRLRGIYSEGLLLRMPVPNDPDWPFYIPVAVGVGDDLAATLGITKYEEPIPVHMRGEAEAPLSYAPYYDVESGFKYGHVFEPGEEVVVTEKLHGTNFRACYDSERGFMVGSHGMWWKFSQGNLYWQIAMQYDLANKLKDWPNMVFYGEIFGQVQDMKYDSKPGERWLRIFDIYDGKNRWWLSWDAVKFVCDERVFLPFVPVVWKGPFSEEVAGMSSGKSLLAGHFREGVVVHPTRERTHPDIGRVIVKYVSEEYKLRKNGTELK